MSYRKFRASQLFTGYELLNDTHVLITDEQGIIESIVPNSEAGDGVQEFNGIISPGLINCHCHLELSHLKGIIPEKTGMTDFILAVVRQRNFPEESIFAAVESAEQEMLLNGMVAVGDICNSTHTLLQKQKGRLYYHNFIEATGVAPAIAEERFSKSVSFFNQFAGQYALPIESNSIVPHAPYSVSQELFHRIVNFPGNHVLTMHNQESVEEEELFRAKLGDFLRLFEQMNIELSFFQPTQKSSLQTVLPYFKKNQTLILVHNVTTSEEDISYLKTLGSSLSYNGGHIPDLYFCLCPNANLYIGNNLPNVDLLMNSGFPIVMGTDSLASNNQLSIAGELKTLQKYIPQVGLLHLLKWATINGARALQLDELLGSFEKGKQPGVILFEDTGGNEMGLSNKVVRLL